MTFFVDIFGIWKIIFDIKIKKLEKTIYK